MGNTGIERISLNILRSCSSSSLAATSLLSNSNKIESKSDISWRCVALVVPSTHNIGKGLQGVGFCDCRHLEMRLGVHVARCPDNSVFRVLLALVVAQNSAILVVTQSEAVAIRSDLVLDSDNHKTNLDFYNDPLAHLNIHYTFILHRFFFSNGQATQSSCYIQALFFVYTV